MYTPRILHCGPFDFSKIGVEADDDAWTASAKYDQLVLAAWVKRLDEARAQGNAIWDGTYYRVKNVPELCRGSSSLELRLGIIPYRYIATFRLLHEAHSQEGLDPLYHLSTTALIRTRDRFFLFGKRARDGAIDLIGGGAQKDELTVEFGSDLEQNVLKEIREEVGIGTKQIERVRGLGALLSTTSNVLIVAMADIRLSRNEAELQFICREEDEMEAPVFVSENDLRDFLRGMTDYRALIPSLPL
jgi:8-oxo-dGTP pyrophosphatase MutT (NUDIX family)